LNEQQRASASRKPTGTEGRRTSVAFVTATRERVAVRVAGRVEAAVHVGDGAEVKLFYTHTCIHT